MVLSVKEGRVSSETFSQGEVSHGSMLIEARLIGISLQA